MCCTCGHEVIWGTRYKSSVFSGCRGETGVSRARQAQASSTQITVLSPVLQAPLEVNAVLHSVQILPKCHWILNMQAYNLQQGTVQMGLEFFSRPCHYVKASCLPSLCLWLFLSRWPSEEPSGISAFLYQDLTGLQAFSCKYASYSWP